jgi:hypothetical protein
MKTYNRGGKNTLRSRNLIMLIAMAEFLSRTKRQRQET